LVTLARVIIILLRIWAYILVETILVFGRKKFSGYISIGVHTSQVTIFKLELIEYSEISSHYADYEIKYDRSAKGFSAPSHFN
jgi:hypothetical protein